MVWSGARAPSLPPPPPPHPHRLVVTGQAVPCRRWTFRGNRGCAGWILVLWAPEATAETPSVGGGQGGILCPPPSVTVVARSRDHWAP